MATKGHIPTVRLRRLAAELRRLRATANLTRDEVSAKTGINAATLYRVETARVRPQRRTLVGLLDLYQVSEAKRADTLDLLKGAATQGWLRPYHAELPEEYAAYIGFENEARALRAYESLCVPGLLQTEDYARAMVRGVLPATTDSVIENVVRVRMERQELLTKAEPLQLWAIMDEAALHRVYGSPAIMHTQVERLQAATAMPNVTLQVVPFGAGAHPGVLGAFALLSFPDVDDPEIIFLESLSGEIFLEADDDLRRYSSMFDVLRAVALSPRETMKLLKQRAGEWSKGANDEH